MSAYFYHKEVMSDRGITEKDLPDNLRKYVTTFRRKMNFLKDPEKIREMQEFSQILGEKIAETEIKKKTTISDLKSELELETVTPVQSFEQGGQVKSIEEQIEEDEKAVSEVCDVEENEELVEDSISKEDEVIGKVSDDINQEEEKEDNGLLSFLKW